MNIELLHGDCHELIKNIPDNSIDLVVTDPPYGKLTNCSWDIKPDIAILSKELWRVLKPTGILIVFGLTGTITDWIVENRKEYKYSIVWDKKSVCGFLAAKYRPLRRYELINIFYKKTGTYNPQKTKGKPYTLKRSGKTESYKSGASRIDTVNETGDRYPIDIIPISRDKSGHPTGKPVALMEWLIKTYSNEGDNVLDPFMGTGASGVACNKTDRNYIGIDIEEKYFNAAQHRIVNELQ